MNSLYFRFINSLFFDLALYASTLAVAFLAFTFRHEITLIPEPSWTVVIAAIFPGLCGAFITKHIYREKLSSLRNENRAETGRYESKIDELYDEISMFEKLLRENGRTGSVPDNGRPLNNDMTTGQR